jgi:hypothetical protein
MNKDSFMTLLRPSELAKRYAVELARAYEQTNVPLDQLPYTPDFDRLRQLFARYAATAFPCSRDLWLALCSARKAKRLPKLERRKNEEKDDKAT